MSVAEYLEALMKAGIPEGLPLLELDRRAAALLDIDARTARRYRTGAYIPGPVAVALKLLGQKTRKDQA